VFGKVRLDDGLRLGRKLCSQLRYDGLELGTTQAIDEGLKRHCLQDECKCKRTGTQVTNAPSSHVTLVCTLEFSIQAIDKFARKVNKMSIDNTILTETNLKRGKDRGKEWISWKTVIMRQPESNSGEKCGKEKKKDIREIK
jgi:hypothetical protein